MGRLGYVFVSCATFYGEPVIAGALAGQGG
jgi:hypothetical protein